MSEILDKQICLKLNSRWIGVGFVTIRAAVTFLCSEKDGEKPGFAMDYEMGVDETTGEQILLYTNPVSWEKWIELEVRPTDLSINTSRGQIRAPLIVICNHYSKIPTKTPRVSAGTIRLRDGNVCQYTGRKLAHGEGNLDHIQPRSRGGKETFFNLVWADKKINTLKGDRTPEEAGLKLLRKPKAPPTMAVVITAADAKHPAHKPFLM